jgi:thioredoxin
LSAVEELAGEGLSAVLADESRGVLIDFWSPWCAPCRTMRPHLQRLAEEHRANWRFVAVNAEADADTASSFGVRALPTIVFYREGREAFRFSGTATISSIAGKLDELADQPG